MVIFTSVQRTKPKHPCDIFSLPCRKLIESLQSLIACNAGYEYWACTTSCEPLWGGGLYPRELVSNIEATFQNELMKPTSSSIERQYYFLGDKKQVTSKGTNTQIAQRSLYGASS